MANDWLELCEEIDDGEFDDGLEELAKSIQYRRELVHRKAARRLVKELQPGARVILTNGIKPRYLDGCAATVKKITGRQSAIVELDELPTHRGRPSLTPTGNKFEVPLIHLEVLDDDVRTLKNYDEAENIGDDTEDYEEED